MNRFFVLSIEPTILSVHFPFILAIILDKTSFSLNRGFDRRVHHRTRDPNTNRIVFIILEWLFNWYNTDRVPLHREFLPTRLAFEVPDLLMHPMLTIPHNAVSLFVHDPVIFATMVRVEVTTCGYFLLRPTFTFPQQSRELRFALRRLMFPLILLAKAAIALTFTPQHRWFFTAFWLFTYTKDGAAARSGAVFGRFQLSA
jgi:hypothetical protein